MCAGFLLEPLSDFEAFLNDQKLIFLMPPGLGRASSPSSLLALDSACLLLHSLAGNIICEDGYFEDCEMFGVFALCDMLKTNSSLCELKCVPRYLLQPPYY